MNKKILRLVNIGKVYDGQTILEKIDLTLSADGTYCLMGPSGRGKTTLLRIMAGLEQPDTGEKKDFDEKRISMVFQEDRLFPEMNAVRNLQMVGIESPEALLREILPEDALRQPVSEFSGGMKRRAAVARAIGADSDILLMDEPFTGLDQKTKEQVIHFILRHRKDRMLLLSTHSEEDAEALGAEIICL